MSANSKAPPVNLIVTLPSEVSVGGAVDDAGIRYVTISFGGVAVLLRPELATLLSAQLAQKAEQQREPAAPPAAMN